MIKRIYQFNQSNDREFTTMTPFEGTMARADISDMTSRGINLESASHYDIDDWEREIETNFDGELETFKLTFEYENED